MVAYQLPLQANLIWVICSPPKKNTLSDCICLNQANAIALGTFDNPGDAC